MEGSSFIPQIDLSLGVGRIVRGKQTAMS